MLPPLTTTPTRSRRGGPIRSRQERGESGSAPGLGHDPQLVPERLLRRADCLVGDEHHAVDEAPRDREHQITYSARGERIRSDASGRRIDRLACLERFHERRRGLRLDPQHARRAAIPGGNPGDQPAASDRDEERVERRCLAFGFDAERALAENRLGLIVGVDRQGAGSFGPSLACGERVRITRAADEEIGPVIANALDLGGRGDAGHEDLRPHGEFLRRISDGRAVVSARRSDDARLRNFSREQIGKGAARLERSRMLQLLELQGDRKRVEAEFGRVDLEQGRAADVRPDQRFDLGDARAADRPVRSVLRSPGHHSAAAAG